MAKAKHSHGENKNLIPRTHAAAMRRGYSQIKKSDADLSAAQHASFIALDTTNARQGQICGFTQSEDDPNMWLVCYKDAAGNCNYVHVPKSNF